MYLGAMDNTAEEWADPSTRNIKNSLRQYKTH